MVIWNWNCLSVAIAMIVTCNDCAIAMIVSLPAWLCHCQLSLCHIMIVPKPIAIAMIVPLPAWLCHCHDYCAIVMIIVPLSWWLCHYQHDCATRLLIAGLITKGQNSVIPGITNFCWFLPGKTTQTPNTGPTIGSICCFLLLFYQIQ